MNTRGGWYAAQSKANPDLFRVIFDFNRRPQHWLHPSVMELLPHAPVIQALAGSTHGAGHVSAWLMQELDLLEDEPCWDFEEPRRRLNLLTPATLGRLARHCGATLAWPRIAAVIGRAEIQELKAALGEEAHAFALRRGRMIIPENEAVLPQPGASLAAHVLENGWRLILTAVSEDLGALRRRFKLKLPPDLLSANLGVVAPETRDRAWQRVRKICPQVLTEGEMQCFA